MGEGGGVSGSGEGGGWAGLVRGWRQDPALILDPKPRPWPSRPCTGWSDLCLQFGVPFWAAMVNRKCLLQAHCGLCDTYHATPLWRCEWYSWHLQRNHAWSGCFPLSQGHAYKRTRLAGSTINWERLHWHLHGLCHSHEASIHLRVACTRELPSGLYSSPRC